MDADQLLEQCADMVLRCDGCDIPCIRFHCLISCDVIRNLAEDVDLERDSRGRVVVPFPGVSPDDLRMATHILHGVRGVTSLSTEDIAAGVRGMRALGHSVLDTNLPERLWSVLDHNDINAVRPHLGDLLYTKALRLPVLRRLVTLCPTWAEFSPLLDDVVVSADLATWMLSYLTKFFPAGPVFTRMLGAIPASTLDPAKAVALFTAPKNASSYHPAEALDVVRELRRVFRARGWDPSLLGLLDALTESMNMFDVAPFAANAMHGSVVILERTPAASLLLSVTAQRALTHRKMAPWIVLNVDWTTGAVDARISLDKLGGTARYARTCQVRLTACDLDGNEAEVWYALLDLIPLASFTIRDQGRVAAGSLGRLQRMVASTRLTRLRIDLFYAEHSVLEKAFF